MTFKEQYENGKAKVLNDKSICQANRKWIKDVLEYQEEKGKRSNSLPALDEACYKTLLGYITKMKNTSLFFKNKPLKEITEKDFKQVYDSLEEGRIKKKNGNIFEDRSSYYSKIFKSYPFEILGKKEMAKKIIKYNVKKDKNVRFIQPEKYKEALESFVYVSNPSGRMFIQLCGDIGENIGAILQIQKKDFERKIDEKKKYTYYFINLHRGILKRSRTPRREWTYFSETTKMLDTYLKDLKPEDKLFNFGLRQAEIMFKQAVDKSKVFLQNGEKPTLKDLRSSLACFLLKQD